MTQKRTGRFLAVLCAVFLIAPSFGYAKSYKRIVSLTPSVTEILFKIGAGDQIVGVTTYCIHPEEAKSKPKVGGFTEHNIESIVEQKPDLVIMNPNRGTKFTYEKLNQIGIETLVVPLERLEDIVRSFQLLGDKTGHVAEAENVRREMTAAIEKVRAHGTGRPRKKVAFVTWRSPLMVPGRDTFENDVIELAGGENIAKDSSLSYPKLGMEAFLASDPDLIVEASNFADAVPFGKQKENVRRFWRQYPNLRAVKAQEVYVLKGDPYSVPGPRTVEFMEVMDAILDPGSKHENPFYERIQI